MSAYTNPRLTGVEVNQVGVAGGFAGVVNALDGDESASLLILGDSTGNAEYEWVDLLTKTLAAQYPNHHVKYKVWNDSNQAYDAWSVVQAASGERAAYFPANARSFHLAASNITAITGDIDIRVRASLDNWNTGTAQVLAARYGAAGSRSWILQINSTGRLAFNWTADGTTDAGSIASTNALGFANGAEMWVRVTLDVDNGGGGRTVTLYTSTDGVTWTNIGTSASASGGATSIFDNGYEYEIGGRGLTGSIMAGLIYEVQIRNGIDGPIVNPQPIESWAPRIASNPYVAGTFTGSPTLYVVNGSKAGADLAYLTDSTRFPKMCQPYDGALVFLSALHNEGDTAGVPFYALWDGLYTKVRERMPGSAICVLTQNPRISPSTGIEMMARRARGLVGWAKSKGVYCIDTYSAFMADGRGLVALLNTDGVHPTNASGSNAGSKLWADTVWKAFQNKD